MTESKTESIYEEEKSKVTKEHADLGAWDAGEKAEIVEQVAVDDHRDGELTLDDLQHMHEEDLDIVNVDKIVGTTDDTTLNAFTFRAVLLSALMAALGASVAQLMYFKPVGTALSNTFVLMISYVVLTLWAKYLPSGGWLNPHPFNHKEFACIYVAVNAANTSAYATYILSAQALYYNAQPSEAGAFFLILATQMVGYGIAGQLRRFLVFPANMIWPQALPTVTMIKTLVNEDSNYTQKRAKYFFILFGCAFVYEFIPQYMFPLLGSFSIFCLANDHSVWFTWIFGGSSVNEGLGILSLSFDWNLLSYYYPLILPLWVQLNIYTGILILWLAAPLIYYTGIWDAQLFPFLSNAIWAVNQTDGTAMVYPQKKILTADNEINDTALNEIGNPRYAAVLALSYVVINMGVTASISHVALFYGKQIWGIFRNIGKGTGRDDIHNKLMANYKEVPTWWYYVVYLLGLAINIGLAYANHSGLPWWGVIFAVLLSTVLSLPLNLINAVTGTGFGLNVVAELIFGLIRPGYPVANMYFKTLGYNTLSQAGVMGQDLKVGHYMKVPPRLTFGFQLWGTLIGSIFNYIVNISIINSKRDILLDQKGGNNIWSGAGAQTINSAAITWGGIGPIRMFGLDTPYSIVLWAFIIGFFAPVPGYVLHRFFPKIGFNKINTPMILVGLATLPGANSSWITVSFVVIIMSQWFMKRRHREWFVNYNYLTSAALDSGTSLMVFFLAFAVFGGGSGVAYNFPTWWGNRIDADAPYVDHCCLTCTEDQLAML
ncbi:OPT oligopeptide transporter protein-domain-containing protein [Gongronella butleri]|nr:OPT oligopeptide transporter protein-domain-containing protein [Gongronella butleri]